MNKQTVLRFVIAVVLVAISVWVLSKSVDIDSVQKALSSASLMPALLTIPVVLLSHFMRAIRWRTLLQQSGNSYKLHDMFSAVMIGYAANNIIPRSGEIWRPYIFSKRVSMPLSEAIGSIVAERFIDVLNLLLFVLLAVLLIGDTLHTAFPTYSATTITLSLAIPFFLLLLLIVLVLKTTVIDKVVSSIRFPFFEKVHSVILNALRGMRTSLQSIANPSLYFTLSLQSLTIWLLYVVPMYIMLFAFQFDTPHQFTFFDSCVILIVMAIGITIAPTPGGIGVYHTFVTLALTKLYAVPSEQALAYATLAHAFNYIPVTLIGGAYLLYENYRSK